VNWIYQILKALLDFLRETPPPDIAESNAPKDLTDSLRRRIADLPGLPEQGDNREKR